MQHCTTQHSHVTLQLRMQDAGVHIRGAWPQQGRHGGAYPLWLSCSLQANGSSSL